MPETQSAFTVLYEDNHLIAVNKPHGLLVQEDKSGDVCLSDQVKAYIKEKYEKPGNVFLGTIHRVDRPVSGLVLFARTSKALSRMNELFKNQEVKKTYLAILHGKTPETTDTLEHWLQKSEDKNKVHASSRPRGNKSKHSILHYELMAQPTNKRALVKAHPVTGRPHQIRVQMANIGCPIVGDVKYGFPERQADGNIYLHSYQLTFMHPVKKTEIKIKAPLPERALWNDFKDFLGKED